MNDTRDKRAIAATLVVGVVVVGLHGLAQSPENRRWSPDRNLYAVSEAGQRVGNGEARERFVVYTAAGVQVAVAYVWLIEPDGTTYRAGIRGCERWGWIDESRIFCEGTINPSTSVYLVFDAKTGRELREFIGGHFVWSPDKSRVASFGNVPHFSPSQDKTDSLEIEGKVVYPIQNDQERHWFRSDPTWSADGQHVAVVDHRQGENTLWLVVASVDGNSSNHQLPWTVPPGDWPPSRDASVRWDGQRITVEYAGRAQLVLMQGTVR